MTFVDYHQIDPNSIWGGRIEINALEFLERMENIFGYSSSIQEINTILEISMLNDSKIKIQDLWRYGFWEGQ